MEEREYKYQIEINGFLYIHTGVSMCVFLCKYVFVFMNPINMSNK